MQLNKEELKKIKERLEFFDEVTSQTDDLEFFVDDFADFFILCGSTLEKIIDIALNMEQINEE